MNDLRESHTAGMIAHDDAQEHGGLFALRGRQQAGEGEHMFDGNLTIAAYVADLWETACPILRFLGPAEPAWQ